MKKIIVIGCPGSGKSTLSKELSQKLGIPVYHLDDWQELSKDQFIAKQNELMEGDEWVIDGNFVKTIELRLASADAAIFIDLPKYVVYWRTLKRYLKDTSNLIKHFRGTWGIFKYIKNFPRAEIISILSRSTRAKVIVIHSSSEADRFLLGIIGS